MQTPGNYVPGAHGERQRALGKGVRLFQAASQHLRLPQGRRQSTCEVLRIPIAVACSIARVSRGTASATRPPRASRPKAGAIQEK